jgi:hypothetical protein
MNISQAVLILAVAVAPTTGVAAAPVVRLAPAPIVFPHEPFERHAFGPPGDGVHDVWRHRHHRDFIGPVAPVFGATDESNPATPASVFVSTPVVVNVTLAPADGLAAVEWPPGPKIIEVGAAAPPHGRLPLIIYGD